MEVEEPKISKPLKPVELPKWEEKDPGSKLKAKEVRSEKTGEIIPEEVLEKKAERPERPERPERDERRGG
jgi:hypothetical protein